ncbi:hypothetical protein [Clostridium tyrobutyricum]|uniref:hypothetical protein n=1 Tax=Clostridium tyrobutyricum TaxID=1519 RepID=UPI00057E0B9F|nr:hypothetical protein [Clostridium tyrobutyricum]
MTKKSKIFLKIIVPALIVVGVLYYLVTWNSSDIPIFPQPSQKLALKIIKIPKDNAILTLSNEELNQLIDLYPIGENSFGDLKVKTVYIRVLKGKFNIYFPSKYKGLDILLSTSGNTYLEKGKIVYAIDNFKVGKLNLPKSIVLNIIKNKTLSGLSLKNNKIYIDTTGLPLKMKQLQLKDGSISIKF